MWSRQQDRIKLYRQLVKVISSVPLPHYHKGIYVQKTILATCLNLLQYATKNSSLFLNFFREIFILFKMMVCECW